MNTILILIERKVDSGLRRASDGEVVMGRALSFPLAEFL